MTDKTCTAGSEDRYGFSLRSGSRSCTGLATSFVSFLTLPDIAVLSVALGRGSGALPRSAAERRPLARSARTFGPSLGLPGRQTMAARERRQSCKLQWATP